MQPWNLMHDLKKQQGTSSILHQALCILFKPWVNSNWSYSPQTLNAGQNWRFFLSCVTLKFNRWPKKNNRAPLLCCFKIWASFHSHQWIQTGVTIQKRPIWAKINVLLHSVTLKFHRWPCKTIGHLFYASSGFINHFIANSEFKLELHTVRRHTIWVKIDDSFSGVTLKFDRWAWKTKGYLS